METMDSVIVTLVLKMKEIVIIIIIAKMVLDVQAVQPILDSPQIYIVAHKEAFIMENTVFAQVSIHVALMKVIATMMANVRMDYHVVLTIVLLLLDSQVSSSY